MFKIRHCLTSLESDQLTTKINSNRHKRFELLAKSIKISCDPQKLPKSYGQLQNLEIARADGRPDYGP